MKYEKYVATAVLASCLMASTAALADAKLSVNDVPIDLGWSGFVRADYGAGDRYSAADGKDRLGFTKSLLLLSASTEDIKAVLDFGGTGLTQSGSGGGTSDIGIKDAFIVIGSDRSEGFAFSAGAQPLLFGLKPNGYPSDSSLQANVDYGGGGAFAVSQQAGPSLIGTYRFTSDLSVRFGAFDLAESNTGNTTNATNGSKISKNLFLLLRDTNIGGTGFYGTVGVEEIYVGLLGGPLGTQGSGPVGGAVVDQSKGIYSVGVGFKQSVFDVSAEYISLNSAIVNTRSNERYIRLNGSFKPMDEWTIYGDYSNGQEIGLADYRLGANWQFRRHLAFTAEYSKDDYKSSNEVYNTGTGLYGTKAPPNAQSVDLRLTFTF